MTYRHVPARGYQRAWLWIAAAVVAVSLGLYVFLASNAPALHHEVVAVTTHDVVPEPVPPAEPAGKATIDYDPDAPQAPTF